MFPEELTWPGDDKALDREWYLERKREEVDFKPLN